MLSFLLQVYSTCQKLCAKKMKGFEIDDLYGNLDAFAEWHNWSYLVLLHNDQENDYYIGLHDFCVICHQNLVQHDGFHINFSSM